MSYAFGQAARSQRDNVTRNRGRGSSESAYSAEEQEAIRAKIDLATDEIARQPSRTEQAAAIALHEALDPISVKYDIEIGTFIHAGQDLFSDRFVVGDIYTQFLSDTVTFGRLDLQPTTSYHTHGTYWPEHAGSDHARDIRQGINGYISGAGQLKRFGFESRTTQLYRGGGRWE